MKNIKTLTIDIDKDNYETIPSVQYDSKTRYLHVYLFNSSSPFDITGCSVKIAGIKADNTDIFNECKVIDPKKGFIEIELTEQMNAVHGLLECELKIYSADGVLTTKPLNIYVSKSVTRVSNITSSNEFTALTNALKTVGEIENKADKTELEKLSSQLEHIETKANNPIGQISNGEIDNVKIKPYSITENEISPKLKAQILGEGQMGTDIADGGATYVKIGADVPLNKIPFHPYATLKNEGVDDTSIIPIKKGIKKIELYNADQNKKYTLDLIAVNYVNQWQLSILEIPSNKQVCLFASNSLPSGEVELSSMSEDNITARVWIDWSQFIDGTRYRYMGYDECGIDYSCYLKYEKTIESPKDLFKFRLPKKLYGVVDREFNLYYDNVTLTDNLKNYQVNFISDYGMPLSERLTVVCPASGQYNIEFEFLRNEEQVAKDNTTLVVADKNSGGGSNLKALFIGDSITAYGDYTEELLRLFEADSNVNLELLGTQGSGTNKHEGRGGWTADRYYKYPSFIGTSNPFYNPSTGVFDFNYYMEQQGYSSVDYVVIALGTNDVSQGYPTDEFIGYMVNLVNSIKSYNSNIKVGIALTIPGAYSQTAFGWGGKYSRYTHRKGLWRYYEGLMNTFENRESEGIYIVPINTALDTVNNFKTIERQVNSRNTKTEVVISDNVHPDKSGMYQLSDVYYAWIKATV